MSAKSTVEMLKIEQPGELNRYVDPSIPLTWSYRWHIYRIVLPLVFFCWAAYAPIWLLKIWLEETWRHLGLLVLALALFGGFFAILMEITVRLEQRFKRVLEIKTERLVFGRKRVSLKWNGVRGLRIEPVPADKSRRILTIEYGGHGGKRLHEWSIVVQGREALDRLLHELKDARDQGKGEFAIRVQDQPVGPKATIRIRAPWFFCIGLAFLVYGMPMIGLSLPEDADRRPKPKSERRFQLSGAGERKLERILIKNFKSMKEMERFFLRTGAILTTLGVTLILVDFRRSDRSRKKSANPG